MMFGNATQKTAQLRGFNVGSGGRCRQIIRLALAGFKTRVFLVDDVNPTAAAHDPAAFLAEFRRLERIQYFHNAILEPCTPGPSGRRGAEHRGMRTGCQCPRTAVPYRFDKLFPNNMPLAALMIYLFAAFLHQIARVPP